MRLNKIILKAFLQTFAAVLVLLGILFGVLCLGFPQTMMDMTYSLGMDGASVDYAITAYERFDKVEYIERGADTALQAKLYEKADECLEKLIADDGFASVCERKDAENVAAGLPAGYRAYYLRQLCVAKYEAGKTSAAVDRAIELMDGTFAGGNPLVAVLAAARADGQAGATTLQYAMQKMTDLALGDVYSGYDAAERAYFDQVLATVQKWVGEGA